MNNIRKQGTVRFRDMDAVYFADSCDPLTAAADAHLVELSALARGHYPGQRICDGSIEGVRTIGYWDAPRDQQWGLDWHRNEGIEITYLAKGSTPFAVDDARWDLRAGQVTVTRPWQRHRVGDPNVGASNLHWIIVDVGVRRPNQTWQWPDWVALAPRDLDRLTTLLQHNEHAVWTASATLGEAFVAATALAGDADAESESELRIRISMILLELLRTLESKNVLLDDSLTAPQRGVRLFLVDLEEQLDRFWTLQSMAASCSMGRTQFSRHCQELTNMTPIEFLTHARIKRAKHLLRTSEMAVTDIATLCGFETPQYFATRFRNIVGQPPLNYRKFGNETPSSLLTA